jgi:hypothetical protein
LICAAGTRFAAGMVSTWAANVPKVPVFPVTAELASVQVADAIVKNVLAASVMATAVLNAVALMAVGAAGAGVAATVVVMFAGTAERLVAVKLNGPPAAPVVVFWMATVAGLAVLVNVQ